MTSILNHITNAYPTRKRISNSKRKTKKGEHDKTDHTYTHGEMRMREKSEQFGSKKQKMNFKKGGNAIVIQKRFFQINF